MARCPYCEAEAATVRDEIEHMRTVHPEIIRERLARAGIVEDEHPRRAVEVLVDIREQAGAVCPEYEVCGHPWCNASYAAWALADEYLRRHHV